MRMAGGREHQTGGNHFNSRPRRAPPSSRTQSDSLAVMGANRTHGCTSASKCNHQPAKLKAPSSTKAPASSSDRRSSQGRRGSVSRIAMESGSLTTGLAGRRNVFSAFCRCENRLRASAHERDRWPRFRAFGCGLFRRVPSLTGHSFGPLAAGLSEIARDPWRKAGPGGLSGAGNPAAGPAPRPNRRGWPRAGSGCGGNWSGRSRSSRPASPGCP